MAPLTLLDIILRSHIKLNLDLAELVWHLAFVTVQAEAYPPYNQPSEAPRLLSEFPSL